MKPGMKMMMMDRMMQQRSENNRSEYGGSNRRMIGYDRGEGGNARTSNYGGGGSSYGENRMEGGGGSNYGNRMEYGMEEMENRRRRDSRGRYMESEGYEGNRGYGRNETESRRRRDSRGRYAMGDDEEEEDKRSQTWYPPYNAMPYIPPMSMYPGNSYGDVYAHGSIYAPGTMNKPMGGAMMEQDMSAPVDEHTARKWVQKMDGGEHFKMEQAEQHRMSICPDCDKFSFYVAMNAMYSDHCETAKKLNIDRPDYYAYMAKDFLKDADAKPHKLRRYMEYIAA